MRRSLQVCALVLLAPGTVAAQASRDDAIRMVLAGDYQRAEQALRLLAEDPAKPDPSAQFFLAMLYDTGAGVPRMVMRACGLYRQAAGANGPFTHTAAELGRMLHEDSPVPEQMCSAGPWHELPEALFTLGVNHTVQFTRNSLVLRHEGTEKRVMTGTLPGVITLPPVYTPLDVTHPVRERRHFLQGFVWSPDHPSAPASWTLIWGLTEVVGVEYVHVTVERNLLTVGGARPPADVNLASFARVQVGASGEAEWVVGSGANARSGIVPRRERP